ncbi:MAG: hypothetical protein H6739_07815 [Alphaproteobacteria bacterium]|nr:hypothetical protein [Alphaproteobacteria bacterium]
MPTGALWQRARLMAGVRVGDDQDSVIDQIDRAMTRAWQAATQELPQALARRLLLESYRELVELQMWAMRNGFTTLGETLEELGRRVGNAFQAVGGGLAAILKALLDATEEPREQGLLVMLAALAAVVAVSYSPGGQVMLPQLVRLL